MLLNKNKEVKVFEKTVCMGDRQGPVMGNQTVTGIGKMKYSEILTITRGVSNGVWLAYWFAWAAASHVPQTRWCKQRKFISSQFQVRDQGVGRIDFF